jgi:predicted nuclease with TOPRIM domain
MFTTKYAQLIKREAEIRKARGEREQQLRQLRDRVNRLKSENQTSRVQLKQMEGHLDDKKDLAQRLADSKHYQSMRLFIEVRRIEESIRQCGAEM